MRYFLKLSYDGSAFSGWQVQPNAPTVQECLEKSLSILLKARIPVVGAGRTDAQVNATGYVAHFDFDGPVPESLACVSHSPSKAGDIQPASKAELDVKKIGYKLNAILPHGIVVHEVCPVDENLHARFSASRREYTYFLHRTKDPFIDGFSYFYPFDLDVEAMNKASSSLIGVHDFRCFEKIGSDNKTSICTVFEAFWSVYRPTHVGVMGFPASEGSYLYFRISADRFLRNMVRAVVGSLIEVGRGKRPVESFASLVLPAASDGQSGVGRKDSISGSGIPFRSLAGESVPGHALFLSKVLY